MNVGVKHNGTTITSRVISYQREHKICTGIGTLDITLEGSYSTAIDPWDEIDIYENGDFKVRYYVSEVQHSIPDGTKTLQCQDISKRLVDYFIPTSYTIDYPSYTRYWIELFLTEAGLDFSFTTDSPGNLLSNYTNLGLQPAYDQIMTLLQLSGWYMFFDGNGVAIIGSLNVDLAEEAEHVGLTDILDIKRYSNDKMLRNRALVWGTYDPFTQAYAFADVTKHTPWNYDRRDIRTMVVSNNNIPNTSSAYNIANILIKEFARITVEKHIVLWDARDYTLGYALSVHSHVWRGTGLITTFGVNMDRNGLVTQVILDERCPRLFGFFNFGDYVYVGHFGDGVWRKHIKFDPTWYDFSAGLTDLNITDLHINNNIFGSVGHSGDMFYANTNAGPWLTIDRPSGLYSSGEDYVNVASGVGFSGVVMDTFFSGISARATIVDRMTNIVKFGVDNWSGLNMGDYFMMAASGVIIASGVVASGWETAPPSGMRSWILEYDPFTGEPLTSEIASGVYPVNYSGNYNYIVIDLENDGINDYVSVRTAGSVITNDGQSWNFGQHITQPYGTTHDANGFSIEPQLATYVNDNTDGCENYGVGSPYPSTVAVYDNEITGEIESINLDNPTSVGLPCRYRLSRLSKVIVDPTTTTINRTTLVGPTTTTPGGISLPGHGVMMDGIVKLGPELYRYFYREVSGDNVVFFHYDWNTSTNQVADRVTYYSLEAIGPNAETSGRHVRSMLLGETLYYLVFWVSQENDTTPETTSILYMVTGRVDTSTAVFSLVQNLEFETPQGANGKYFYFPAVGQDVNGNRSIPGTGTINSVQMDILQNGEDEIQVLGWFEIYLIDPVLTLKNYSQEYIVRGNKSGIYQIMQTFEGDVDRPGFISRFASPSPISGEYTSRVQLTLTDSLYYVHSDDSTSSTENTYIITPTTDTVQTGSPPPQVLYTKVRPILNDEHKYVTVHLGVHYLSDASSLSLGTVISAPTGISSLRYPFSSPLHSSFGEIFYLCVDDVDFSNVLVPFYNGVFSTERMLKPASFTPDSYGGVNVGGFFIQRPINFYPNTLSAQASIVYVDMGEPRDNGTLYQVLQREGYNFNLIQEAFEPIRIDISNTSPLLSVQDTEDTFVSSFIGIDVVTQIEAAFSGLVAGPEVRDYRYTLLETTASGTIAGSGLPITTQALYVYESGVWAGDITTYSGFSLYMSIPSGYAERIEITNYTYPGQFIFVTTSGENPMFYQKDNDAYIFTAYSGLPASRATIIRVDDRI